MEKTIDFLGRVNKALSELTGLKVKDADTFHNKKREIITPFLTDGLKYSTWGINDNNHKNIFDLEFQIKRDKRVKNGMVGEIIKAAFRPCAEYVDIDVNLPMDKYLLNIERLNLKDAISKQIKHIEETKIALSEKENYLNTLNGKMQEINKALF